MEYISIDTLLITNLEQMIDLDIPYMKHLDILTFFFYNFKKLKL